MVGMDKLSAAVQMTQVKGSLKTDRKLKTAAEDHVFICRAKSKDNCRVVRSREAED